MQFKNARIREIDSSDQYRWLYQRDRAKYFTP
jgi:hypothetical protein